ncbi:MAG: M3 family oligoendopeptidase [Lentilitoribacter sp.]
MAPNKTQLFWSNNSASQTQELGELPSWNLTDLYESKSSTAFENDWNWTKSASEKFEARWKGSLQDATHKSGDDGLGAAIRDYEQIEEVMGRMASFAGLLYFSNTLDADNAKFYGDMQAHITDASAHLIFFTLELNRIDEKDIANGIKNDPLTAHYKSWILDLRKDKPHQLDENVEQLFHEKSITGHGAWNRLFDETMADLRFTVDGEERPLEATLNLLQEADPVIREKAAKALVETFSGNLRIFTLITNTLAKDKEISDRWRGFDDIADSRHLANRVEREVVDALMTSVKNAYPRLSHRYYQLKAKWLGVEELNYWDRNAPLPETPKSLVSWDDAQQIVLSAYNDFAPEMAETAKDFFDKGWIDAANREGKAPGAFAHPTVPSAHPYVLINYMGKARDVMTLAHELGHGVHQVLAGKQGALMASTPLTLAETASVFGEMLTFRAILNKTEDARERKAILAQKVEDMINTVVRQIAFYDFERKLHTARKKGELTSDQIGELWMSVQAESLGPAIKLDDGYQTFWTYIPHFIHSPFYVYAYAFGDCLVNSLYAVYQNADDGFQERYFDMLKAGGTKHHSELLVPFGLDATQPDFWDKGLSMIEGLINELEELDKQLG